MHKNKLRLLVCGGRDYRNHNKVFEVLDSINRVFGIKTIINGGANGADRLGKLWARSKNKECFTINADWGKHGKAAGPIRNQEMLSRHKPHIVVAFSGGRGTKDMIDRSYKEGVLIFQYD